MRSAMILANVFLAVAVFFTGAMIAVTYRGCHEAGDQLGLDTSWSISGCSAQVLGTRVKIPLTWNG